MVAPTFRLPGKRKKRGGKFFFYLGECGMAMGERNRRFETFRAWGGEGKRKASRARAEVSVSLRGKGGV